jgi:hypothetical protein
MPDRALVRLERHRPVLAVIDLGMSLALRARHRVEEVLAALYQARGGASPSPSLYGLTASESGGESS